MLKWFNKFINPSCLCCGKIATKDVREIPLGEHILLDLIRYKYLTVSLERYKKIEYRFNHTHLAKYPLCIQCYEKVEGKWKSDKAKADAIADANKKEVEISEYYKKLAKEVERKELETRAKALGIDLDKQQ